MSPRFSSLFCALSAFVLLGVPTADASCPVGTPITAELSCSCRIFSYALRQRLESPLVKVGMAQAAPGRPLDAPLQRWSRY